MKRYIAAVVCLFVLCSLGAAQQPCTVTDDASYTQQIREFTTDKAFSTELVDHLPQSSCVPAPDTFLHHIVGAPNVLDYNKDINAYMRLLESKSPRVKVMSIGKSEEGREMIAVFVSDEANLASLDRNREIMAKLADPRTITDAEAQKLITEAKPIYWADGSIHSPETGSPEMLMELAYRLAVEDTPFIQTIRKNSIVMITPVVEVDGHDREVDIYMRHVKHPDEQPLPLTWWGHYVSHDNNRDSLGMSLALSRNMLATWLQWHPTVMHDLHESVPYLYIMTGTGPYNAWLDPIVINEWQQMAYYEIQELTKRGVIGVWTHGFYDGWAPNYLLSIANGHNGIGRFYETFGNGGADTRERTLSPSETSREWYRPNPPLAKVKWSFRNNINMQESAILFGMYNVASNAPTFLNNFYLKSKRAVEKARTEGPAAWVFPADDPRPAEQASLLRLLQMQGVEVSKLTKPFTVKEPPTADGRRLTAKSGDGQDASMADGRGSAAKTDDGQEQIAQLFRDAKSSQKGKTKNQQPKTSDQQPSTVDRSPSTGTVLPAGSYVIRMDQPYSRLADMVLDTQYYSPNDPRSYDDTGWTLGALHDVKTVRVLDTAILDDSNQKVEGEVRAPGGVQGSGKMLLINNTGESALTELRFRFPQAKIDAAEEPFEAGGEQYRAGTFILHDADRSSIEQAAKELGLMAQATDADLKVKTHPLAAPRIALVHSWQSTQNDGWFRIPMDEMKVPYTYLADTKVRDTADLRSQFDVIIVPPMGPVQNELRGIAERNNTPLPWENTAETPNLVAPGIDQASDIRGGLGVTGVANLEKFVAEGGLLMAVQSSAELPVAEGMTEMVNVGDPRQMQASGSVVKATIDDPTSPIAYGYDSTLYLYYNRGPVITVGAPRFGFGGGGGGPAQRSSGRGSLTDPDVIQARPYIAPEKQPKRTPREQEMYVPEDMREFARWTMPAPAERPRVIVRFAPEKDLVLSGLIQHGNEIAEKPAVVDVPHGKGHILLFANNPMWRNQTQGSWPLVFNAIMNFDHLDAGRTAAPKTSSSSQQSEGANQE
jgi:hypothetical protein